MKYYIIGNGFDIAHGLSTSYSDFVEVYKESNYLTKEEHQLWSDFENEFSLRTSKVINETSIDADEIRDEIYVEDHYDVICPSGDSCQPYYSFLNSFKEEDINKFTIEFKKYLQSLNYNNIEKKYILEEACAILSFNYTLYAKDLYKTKFFWNIHGQLNCDILFGYNSCVNKVVDYDFIPEIADIKYDGSDPGDFLAELQSYDRTEDIHGILDKADEIVLECMNNIKEITDKYDKALSQHRQSVELEFYSSLKNEDEIMIIGHSLGEADSDFFTELDLKCTERGIPITCYYYENPKFLEQIICRYNWNFTLKNVEELYM